MLCSNSLEWSILVILLRWGHVICMLQTLHWFSILCRVKVPKFMFWPSSFFILLEHFHSPFFNIPNHASSPPSPLKEAHSASCWSLHVECFAHRLVLASSLTSCEASYLKFQSLFQTFTSSIPTLLFSPLHLYLDLLTTHEIFCLFIEFMLCPTRMSVLDMQVFLSYFTAGDVVHN